jgi:hypothetical protein
VSAGEGGARLSLAVVPANAGAHNHRPWLWSKAADYDFKQHPPRRMGPCFRRDDVGRERTFSFPRRDLRPSFVISLPLLRTEGAGNAGCTLHPRSRVPRIAHFGAHEHTGSAETLRHPPRNVFTAYFVLSPVERACCHRRPRETCFPGAFRQHRGARTTRLRRTQQNHSPLDRCVHRIPRPTCRDDGDTPLWWARDGAAYNSDFQKRKAKYFCVPDWTTQISLKSQGNLDFRRRGFSL